MARALNGLHWQSPLQSMPNRAQTQVNAGVGFGSVLILSHSGTPPTGEPVARDNIYWLEYNMRCQPAAMAERVIVRLYYPSGSLPSANDLAALWGAQLRWCQGQGVQHFQVLNELDLEYQNPYPDATYMSNLATALRSQGMAGWPLSLGFPGPSLPTANDEARWNAYWDRFASAVNNNYNWLALHPYATSLQGLKDSAWAQATRARTRFPNRPQRFCEYAIPLSGEPGGDHSRRATMYRDFINWLRSGWTDYVLAAHVYIAADSPSWPDYQLSDGEAESLANGVGCVGQ